MKVEVKKIEGMERERERGKWWVLFFIIMLSPKISSALDFEEVGVISERGRALSNPSIAVNPLNGEVCVAYQDCCEENYADVRVKCLRDGSWQGHFSIILCKFFIFYMRGLEYVLEEEMECL